MAAHECYHCKQWVEDGEAHDCWTTTEAALTGDLSADLRDAWERLRETAVEFGEQRIYASHRSIMFSRTSCYFFVRPKRSYLEVCVFLGRSLKTPLVRNSGSSSKSKFWNIVRVVHRDQVEAPITDWLREAYEQSELLAKPAHSGRATKRGRPATTKRSTSKTRATSAKTRAKPKARVTTTARPAAKTRSAARPTRKKRR